MKNEEKLLSDEELDEVNGGAIPNIPGLSVSFNQSRFNQKLRNAQTNCSGVIGQLPDEEELEKYEKELELVKYTADQLLEAGENILLSDPKVKRIK